MKAVLVKNGTAYPCVTAERETRNGFLEIHVRITDSRSSVLYSAGSHHWVLPSELHAPETVKRRKGGLLIQSTATARAEFLKALGA